MAVIFFSVPIETFRSGHCSGVGGDGFGGGVVSNFAFRTEEGQARARETPIVQESILG